MKQFARIIAFCVAGLMVPFYACSMTVYWQYLGTSNNAGTWAPTVILFVLFFILAVIMLPLLVYYALLGLYAIFNHFMV